ncbi:MAG: ABC transporter ATP-binding protein [Nitrososphaeraceae archaeon]
MSNPVNNTNNYNSNNKQHYCISVKNLVKSYDSSNLKRNVIDDISFDIDYGTVFGFLGPNGAGKTTTIKILTGILQPTAASYIKILGKDIKKNNFKEIKRRIGVITQNPSFESNLTVERSMELYGFLWGNSSNKNKDKVRELLDIFELTSIKEIRNEDLSIGQRRRVQIAREFLHDMDLLFLDEPTVGLDPRARRNLLNYIKKQVKCGLTVFFTTHIMEEVEYLCNQICIINKGKIIEFDTPQILKQKYGSTKKIDIILQNPISKYIHDYFQKLSANSIDIENIENTDNTLSITSNNPQNVLLAIVNFLFQNNIQIENISLNDPSIEEVFLKALKNNTTSE